MHPNRLWYRYRQQQRQGARESRRSREGLVGNLKGLNHRYVQVFFITLFPLLNIYIPLDYAFGTNNHTQTPLATMSQPRSPPALRHQWMAQWMDARPYDEEHEKRFKRCQQWCLLGHRYDFLFFSSSLFLCQIFLNWPPQKMAQEISMTTSLGPLVIWYMILISRTLGIFFFF